MQLNSVFLGRFRQSRKCSKCPRSLR